MVRSHFAFPSAILSMLFSCVLAINQSDRQYILQRHNNVRRTIANGLYGYQAADMRKLVWNMDLEQEASRFISCDFREGANTEALNTGSRSHGGIGAVLDDWISEAPFFSRNLQSCLDGKHCGRYQRMIHSDYRYVGCAYKNDCSFRGQRFGRLLCKYAGSHFESPAFKVGTPCTKCHGETNFCDDGLCVSCTGNDCDCRKSCFKSNIGFGVLTQLNCSCTCTYGMGPNCDEECRNPQFYLDYDICAEIVPHECWVPDVQLLCPTCTCSPLPNSTQSAEGLGSLESAINKRLQL